MPEATVVVFWKGDRRMTREELADIGPDVIEMFGKGGVAVVGVAVQETAQSAQEVLTKGGTMAYEMCSGRRPFEGENNSLTTIILKVVSEPPPPMDVTWSRSFPEIERIVTP